MIRVNLGCGTCYHKDWINLDANPCGPEVTACDVRGRLPFTDGTVDLVYHSHVLEHLTEKQGRAFLRECHRILLPGGIIRVVVPDLEGIARAYLKALDVAAAGGDTTLHDWTRLELFDQAAREVSGGGMVPWLKTLNGDQVAQVRLRAGREIDAILFPAVPVSRWRGITPGCVLKKIVRETARLLVTLAGGRTMRAAFDEARFRQTGEVHRVMYDRVRLASLLRDCGFAEPAVMLADQSRSPDFGSSGLDVKEGKVRKPDSLFMEAVRA